MAKQCVNDLEKDILKGLQIYYRLILIRPTKQFISISACGAWPYRDLAHSGGSIIRYSQWVQGERSQQGSLVIVYAIAIGAHIF